MRDIVLLVVMVVWPLVCFTQEYQYVQFPLENAEWKSDKWSQFCENPINYCGSQVLSTGSEVIINDTIYSKIYYGDLDNQTQPIAAVRAVEDSMNRKIYVRSLSNPHNEIILYDFNLSVGDTLPFVSWESYEANGDQTEALLGTTLVVHDIDSVEVNGDGYLRKRFHFFEHAFGSSWPVQLKVIEGVGSTAGLGVEIDFSEFEHNYQLQCLKVQGDFVYGYTLPQTQLEYYQQFGYEYCMPPLSVKEVVSVNPRFGPNPIVGNGFWHFGPLPIADIHVFDMMGRELDVEMMGNRFVIKSSISHGIYIVKARYVNGKVSQQSLIKQ